MILFYFKQVTEDGSFSYYALTKETNEEIRAIKKECARIGITLCY